MHRTLTEAELSSIRIYRHSFIYKLLTDAYSSSVPLDQVMLLVEALEEIRSWRSEEALASFRNNVKIEL